MRGGRKCPETSYVVLTNACSFIVVSCKPVLIVFVVFHFSLFLILRDLPVKKNFDYMYRYDFTSGQCISTVLWSINIKQLWKPWFLNDIKTLSIYFNGILKHEVILETILNCTFFYVDICAFFWFLYVPVHVLLFMYVCL